MISSEILRCCYTIEVKISWVSHLVGTSRSFGSLCVRVCSLLQKAALYDDPSLSPSFFLCTCVYVCPAGGGGGGIRTSTRACVQGSVCVYVFVWDVCGCICKIHLHITSTHRYKARGWCQPPWLSFGESWQATSQKSTSMTRRQYS